MIQKALIVAVMFILHPLFHHLEGGALDVMLTCIQQSPHPWWGGGRLWRQHLNHTCTTVNHVDTEE